MCGSKKAISVGTPRGAAALALPVTTVTAARNSCGAVVCTQESTSSRKTPRLAGMTSAPCGVKKCADDDGDDNDGDNDNEATFAAAAAAAPALSTAGLAVALLWLCNHPLTLPGIDDEAAATVDDRVGCLEGAGGGGYEGVDSGCRAACSMCCDAGRRIRVRRNGHTRTENSGAEPNSCEKTGRDNRRNKSVKKKTTRAQWGGGGWGGGGLLRSKYAITMLVYSRRD